MNDVDRDATGRRDALEQIVAVARRHRISATEITAALQTAEGRTDDGRRRAILVRVLSYLGGTFVFAGIGVFVALQWDDLNSAARVIVTLGSGLAALVLALLAIREERYERATVPLLLVAAALEPTGMLVAFDEFGSGGDWRLASLVTSGTMAIQFGAVFASLRRSTPLLLTIAFAALFWWTALDRLDVDDDVIAFCLGGALILAAFGIDRTPHADVTPPIYFFGAIAFLFGCFDLAKGTSLEIVFLGIAAALVYLATLMRSRTLLFVATIAILAYTGYYTGEHFVDSIGWPVALIAFGLFMIGLSALAFRIDRQYVRRAG